MKTVATTAATSLLGLFLGAAIAFAAPDVLPGKIGDYGRYYGAGEMETFTGTVTRVHAVPYSDRSSHHALAVEVERDVGGGDELVYLGPHTRVEEAGLSIVEGAEICVTGSRVKLEGRDVFIAQHLNDRDRIVTLRSESGRHFAVDSGEMPEHDSLVCVVALR